MITKKWQDYQKISQRLEYLKKQTHRPLIVGCSGPSLREIDYSRLPENSVVFRANHFYLEEYLYLKTDSVHVLGITGDSSNGPSYIKKCLFGSYYKDLLLTLSYNDFIPVLDNDLNQIAPNCDVLELIRQCFPKISEFWDLSLSATTGVRLILWGAAVGFREIYVAGLDFFQNTSERYAFALPEIYLTQVRGNKTVREREEETHQSGGYTPYHSLESEIAYLRLVLEECSDLKLYTVCPTSLSATILPLAPILDTRKNAEPLLENKFKITEVETECQPEIVTLQKKIDRYFFKKSILRKVYRFKAMLLPFFPKSFITWYKQIKNKV